MKLNRMLSKRISVNFTVKQIHRLVLIFKVLSGAMKRRSRPGLKENPSGSSMSPQLHQTFAFYCSYMHMYPYEYNWFAETCIFMHPKKWRWGDSNPCPNIFYKSFLHAYFVIDCRKWTGNKQTNSLLSCMVLSNRHSLRLQDPVLSLSRLWCEVTGEPAITALMTI